MSRWSTSSLHTISNNTLSLWKLSGQRRQWMLDYLHDHTQKKDRPYGWRHYTLQLRQRGVLPSLASNVGFQGLMILVVFTSTELWTLLDSQQKIHYQRWMKQWIGWKSSSQWSVINYLVVDCPPAFMPDAQGYLLQNGYWTGKQENQHHLCCSVLQTVECLTLTMLPFRQ